MRFGHKFGAKKTECSNGHSHGSRKEAKRCDELHMMQAAGLIRNLQIQPVFHFEVHGKPVRMGNGQNARYTADFRYDEAGQGDTVEESKGMVTQDFRLRWALAKATWPQIRWIMS